MQVAVVHQFKQPLVMEDRPIPTPGPGQVVVRVEASGLCHTDIHAAHGDWPVKPSPPFVPGHEGVGIVERVGAGVDAASRRATASPSPGSAGPAATASTACRAGRRCACTSRTPATRSTAATPSTSSPRPPSSARVPDGIDPLDAAPLTCAGVTTYKAVKVSGTRPSDLVAVFGIGGLGHLAMQYAKIAGGTVVAVDVVDESCSWPRTSAPRTRSTPPTRTRPR